MKTKKEIKPYGLAKSVAKFINESFDEEWDDPANDAAVNSIEGKWTSMVNDIEKELHFQQVVERVAKKHFPAAASKIAAWIVANINFIYTNGYPEDWLDFSSGMTACDCAEQCKLGIAGMAEGEKKEELDETEPEDGEGDDA